MFGCICPNNSNRRRCDKIFTMVNHNPCVGESSYDARFVKFCLSFSILSLFVCSYVYFHRARNCVIDVRNPHRFSRHLSHARDNFIVNIKTAFAPSRRAQTKRYFLRVNFSRAAPDNRCCRCKLRIHYRFQPLESNVFTHTNGRE